MCRHHPRLSLQSAASAADGGGRGAATAAAAAVAAAALLIRLLLLIVVVVFLFLLLISPRRITFPVTSLVTTLGPFCGVFNGGRPTLGNCSWGKPNETTRLGFLLSVSL